MCYILNWTEQLHGQYLVQQAKFGVLLFWVFAARVRMFLHQENISFFTLGEKKQNYNYINLAGDAAK